MFYQLILLCLLSVSNLTWGANNIATIDDWNGSYNIAKSGSYFIDTDKTLSFETIKSEQYTKRFLPINHDFLQFGLTKGNIWIRSDIAIRTTTNTPILLEISASRVQNIEVFFPTLNDKRKQTELGSIHPYNNKPIKSAKYIFSLPESTPPIFAVYIKLSSHLPINAQIEIKNLSELSSGFQKDFILTGIFLGILLILFVSNLFFYIKSFHSMYLIYACLLISIAVLHLTFHDQIAQFFPNMSGIQERLYNLSALLGLSCIVFFSKLYLDTKTHFPITDKVLLTLGTLNLLLAIIFTYKPEDSPTGMLSFMAIITLSILTFHAIASFIKKISLSGYYLVTRLSLLIGLSTWIMSIYGIIPSSVLLEWGLSAALITEAFLHFIGVTSKKSPLFQKNTYKTKHAQTEIFDLLSDLSSRLRRQINIIGGGLTHLEQAATSPDTKLLLTSSQTANNNLKNLMTRIDYLSHIDENASFEQTLPISLNSLIDNAHHNFQRTDQDSSHIEININKTDNVEILRNTQILQHLIEVLAEEFKHFTNQTLTFNMTHHHLNREGASFLELNCYPLPTRVHANTTQFDFGMSYITLLIEYLGGEINLSADNQLPSANIRIPVQSHIRNLHHITKTQSHFDIILFGQKDNDLQKVLTLLQNHQNKIEHFSTLESVLDHLNSSTERTSGLIIVIFDNGGHIPHITQQRLLPLMHNEDQCLLVSNNVKMSLDYIKKLGFDDILFCAELDNQFKPMLSRLIQKGDLIKNTSLSRIKDSNKAP